MAPKSTPKPKTGNFIEKLEELVKILQTLQGIYKPNLLRTVAKNLDKVPNNIKLKKMVLFYGRW